MVLPNVPKCPETLKGIQHYLTIAAEHDGRDPVVSYWCRLYATQQGMKIDKSTPEAKKLLIFLLDWLEKEKTAEKENEAIAHEIPAQAYLENYALKLFMFADQQDRAGVFNKNVVKAFYTSGMLYAMMEMFGELTEEVSKNQKYAKWKAAYIHNCLKNGEVPVPGPLGGESDEGEGSEESSGAPQNLPGASAGQAGPPGGWSLPPTNPGGVPDPSHAGSFNPPDILPARKAEPPPPSPAPAQLPFNIPPAAETESGSGPVSETGVPLTPEQIAKAQKLCKYASSALNYDDVGTAIGNLRKALTLLSTGREE